MNPRKTLRPNPFIHNLVDAGVKSDFFFFLRTTIKTAKIPIITTTNSVIKGQFESKFDDASIVVAYFPSAEWVVSL